MRSTKPCYHVFLLSLLLLLTATGLRAQTIPIDAAALPQPKPSQTPAATSSPSLEKEFFKNILRDQRAIITAPFHLKESDARFLLPLGATTAALIATDRHTAGALGDDQTRLRVSRDISYLGEFYTTGGIAGAFYLIGRATHSEHARETGLLGIEALIDSGIDVQALKVITQRPRPRVDDASGEFFDRGNSFPSGHAISAWSLATVIAHEYGARRPFVRVGAYALATAVSLSRYTGRNHFLSDALVGSALGYGIGRYVYVKHHDPNLDGTVGRSTSIAKSKWLPLIAPQFHAGDYRTRVYAGTLAWNF